jgi:hypothetical protein
MCRDKKMIEEFRANKDKQFRNFTTNFTPLMRLSPREELLYWIFRWQSVDGVIDYMAIRSLCARLRK